MDTAGRRKVCSAVKLTKEAHVEKHMRVVIKLLGILLIAALREERSLAGATR